MVAHDIADKRFSGAIPEIYDAYLVPLMFQHYADDIAARVALRRPARVLEVAAGTGVVTRALSNALDESASIVATDLNPAMLERARANGTARPVEWRQADALCLPFDDASFDAVVCQFGAMFFPDKPKAFAQMRRVLRTDGVFIFNVWDRIEHNAFALTVTQTMSRIFATDPPMFFVRTPHDYYERSVIERDLRGGSFDKSPTFDDVAGHSRADSAMTAAIGFCQGTPLRFEIEARGPDALSIATDACAAAIADEFGHEAIEGAMQATVVIAET
ncbi:methyltransferase domain-containing protein [Caballeronia sp. LZ019]|uniref:class I SAM-dependent methyltransferase n=1 Tax=Caballeronia sp. LZ019 TaxID=3038555 RepID=UPI002856C267|nr:methyltransferase domain-containing protein [Caballeronia sp. LZ019]MDR5807164.1 methyltransferase domain-containing protein [Caballeronia sp. LZ019]